MKTFRQFLDKPKKYEYSSLMIEPPEQLTDNIISWGYDNIPNELLFSDPEDPTFGREDDIHITLIYGIHVDEPKQVFHYLDEEKSFECILKEMSLFKKNDKFDVLIIQVDCEKLHELHRQMWRSIEITESHSTYIPHVTIAYLKKGEGEKYIGNQSFKDEKFLVDKLIFSATSGQKTSKQLGTK